MIVTKKVQGILDWYESDNPGSKTNIARILMHGKLRGSGNVVILPVDQGFEHGPARSFSTNSDAYDPKYHYKLAVDAGLSAYAAPLGMLEVGADSFAGQIPTILKMNSSNSLSTLKDQAITSSVSDALRLGCSAIGFTIYPGSEQQFDMMEEVRELSEEAKSVGLAIVIWSYPRGGNLSKEGEISLDICAYATHMAALLGAHIIKVKPPIDRIEQPDAKKAYSIISRDFSFLSERVKHIKEAAFAGRRIVVFSGGSSKSLEELYTEIRSIRDGGGDGSIIGRNSFQRPRDEALTMLNTIINIYKNKF